MTVTDTLGIDIAEERLDNGLRVFVAENHTVQAVTVNLWYGVGSRHEQVGQTGLAHLFEHLMFQGSANVAAGEHMTLLESFGADLNATTSFDRTNYFQTVPTRALELALWLEADRMGGLPAALDQRNLDNQRDVVRNERRERFDNQPYGDAYERMHALLFPPGHGYHHLPIGSMADLAAASLDDVRAFFEKHYEPGNAVLSIVGDVEPREAFALAARYFGHLPPGDSRHERLKEVPPLPALEEPVHAEASADVPAEALICGWRLPADGTEEFDAAAVALRILGGGASSRLQELLTRQNQLAQGVYATAQDLTVGTAAGLVMVHAHDDVSLTEIEGVLMAELGRFIETGPTEAELERALAQAEREWLESTATLDGLADEISRAACLFGSVDRVGETVARMRAVTTERVHSVVRAWLNPHQRVQLTYRKEQS
ncbi:pitrilysin family protein [Streptomyces sp. NPDC005483]|uniref:M16 family metallopeptidase n=1 Tax=Streptomyces sp. NPDC005483 TaxID=3154882 RepID=UPI0033A6FC4B